jgi:hypothetical protein
LRAQEPQARQAQARQAQEPRVQEQARVQEQVQTF